MRCLAIDCATLRCSVALFEAQAAESETEVPSGLADTDSPCARSDFPDPAHWQVLASASRDLGRGHAEQLLPMIAALPDKGRAELVAVALGPGSFTGVRVGIAAARALTLSWDAKLVGYSTMALVAAQAQYQAQIQEHGEIQSVTVAMAGGHGEWFVQGYESDGAEQTPLYSLPPAQAVEYFNNTIVAGSSASEFAQLRNVKQAYTMLPQCESLRLLKNQHFTCGVSPIYGREPDAKVA